MLISQVGGPTRAMACFEGAPISVIAFGEAKEEIALLRFARSATQSSLKLRLNSSQRREEEVLRQRGGGQ